jgi:hypothetical protein
VVGEVGEVGCVGCVGGKEVVDAGGEKSSADVDVGVAAREDVVVVEEEVVGVEDVGV